MKFTDVCTEHPEESWGVLKPDRGSGGEVWAVTSEGDGGDDQREEGGEENDDPALERQKQVNEQQAQL